jgi:ABC-2 type transport system permease protein
LNLREYVFLDQLKRSLAIAKKNLRIYYRRGPVVIFGLIMPFFLFLAFFMGREMPIDRLFTGLLGMTIFFSSMSIGPAIVPFEARSRTLERLLSTPISVWALLMGDVIASFIYGFLISFISLAIGLFLGISITNSFVLISGMGIAAFCFSAFSVLLSAYPPTDIPSTVMMISNLVKFPLVFISGVFIPIWEMEEWGRIAASFSPLTYFTDLVNYSTNQGFSYYSVLVDFVILAGFTVLFLVLAVKIHERSLSKRLA